MTEKNGAKDTIFGRNYSLNIRGQLRQLEQPWTMGILNLTPDSFYAGSRQKGPQAALERARQMLEEGAQILDIGAASSRPGAQLLSPREEIQRLTPTLKLLREKLPGAILSVDTFQAEVAQAAADLGADMINDISGGTLDPAMPATAGRLGLPVVLMHIRGNPQNMRQEARYEHLIREISLFLSRQMALFREKGVADIIVDPGFGFAKNLEHNYQLLARLDKLHLLEAPLLVGLSRKSMIGKLLGTSPEESLNGTTAVHMLALQKGAHILRVHDVRAAAQAIKILTFTQKFS